MSNKHLFCFLFFFSVLNGWSGTGVLDRIITVEISNTPIKTILLVIEKRAAVQFSYNPDLIEESKVVSLSIQRKTIAYGLSLIFHKSVRFKEVGNHIVLLKNEDTDELRKRKKSSTTTKFKGVIINKETGAPIQGVSIYDIDARYAAVSNKQGGYTLEIPTAETIRSLYIRKKGYKEYVFVVDATHDSVIVRNISLVPNPGDIEKIDLRGAQKIYLPIEERALSGALVSYDTYVHAENLEEIKESRWAQISLVPSLSIGSNLSTNGLITNNFSLNVIAGYSNGVEGLELGGVFNMVKGDAKWVQAAGVYNMVGGDFTGTQFGGVLNSVRGDFLGLQAGGVTSATGGNFTGMQVGGILSSNHKDVLGFQVGGISALTKGRLEGMQLAGIFTASYCGFRGIQVAGISTVSDSVSVGMQISGIHNAAHGELQGAQLAGISNYSRSGINFLQGAGIGNIADKNYGLQAAGIFNFAKRNDCLQIGLVNTSVDGKGVSIGLINFVAKGYHKTEVSTNELFLANVTLKSGVRHFYNVYNFSAQFGPNPTYAAGFGFGTNFDLKGKWTMSCDLSGQMLFEDHFESFGNQLYKFSTTADRELAKWVTVFFGPTLNINVIQLKDAEGAYTSNLDLASIYDEEFPEARVRMSVGGRIGFRF